MSKRKQDEDTADLFVAAGPGLDKAQAETETRLNVRVPTALHGRFKALCALNGETVTTAIIRFMQAEVDAKGL
ncbi:hypothetical protein [Novosphingobium sp. TCA1]|uniref:hypothetical protein n=1 Tax=Novosphingobium sp. TCA1 TaxID=2682474 RepID=UPI00130C2C6D|nr:hypothetical protein [Novosphingobium sp. TCA1]GFE77721.1 hypothetical protein NTCA1_53700 [Novosphingobium sp. TCA1]